MSSWLGNLRRKALTSIDIPLARENLTVLVRNLTLNIINKLERKTSRKVAVRAGKILTLFYSKRRYEWYSDVLIDDVTEPVKHEMKKQEGEFLGALLVILATLLVQPVVFAVVKGISGRGVRRAGRGYIDKKF